MAKTAPTDKTETKTKQVSAQISIELFDKLEDHRWDARLNMADLVRLAIEEYAASRGLLSTDEGAPQT